MSHLSIQQLRARWKAGREFAKHKKPVLVNVRRKELERLFQEGTILRFTSKPKVPLTKAKIEAVLDFLVTQHDSVHYELVVGYTSHLYSSNQYVGIITKLWQYYGPAPLHILIIEKDNSGVPKSKLYTIINPVREGD